MKSIKIVEFESQKGELYTSQSERYSDSGKAPFLQGQSSGIAYRYALVARLEYSKHTRVKRCLKQKYKYDVCSHGAVSFIHPSTFRRKPNQPIFLRL